MMQIQLFIGKGWTPFTFEEGESLSWVLPNLGDLDIPASAARLSAVFAERVREVYSHADVEILPAAAGNGALCDVELGGITEAEIDAALELTAEDLEDEGYSPAEMIEGEIEGILDGIIQDRTHTWKVER
jgi:hypothetical protein